MNQNEELTKLIKKVTQHGISLERKVVNHLCELECAEIAHSFLYYGEKRIKGERPFLTQREIDVMGSIKLTIPKIVREHLDYSINMGVSTYSSIDFLLAIECKYNKNNPLVLFQNHSREIPNNRKRLGEVFRCNAFKRSYYNYFMALPNVDPRKFEINVGTVVNQGRSINLEGGENKDNKDQFYQASEEINSAIEHFCHRKIDGGPSDFVMETTGILVVSDGVYLGKINSASNDFELTVARDDQYFYYDPMVDKITTQSPFYVCAERALPTLVKDIIKEVKQLQYMLGILVDMANRGELLDQYNKNKRDFSF